MKKINNLLIICLLIFSLACKKDNEAPETGTLKGVVSDAVTAANLENAQIIIFNSDSNTPVKSLATGADGNYQADLSPGSYYLKIYKQGYDNVPPRNISPIPFTVIVGSEINNPVEMNLSTVQNGGSITGKISENGTGVAGVLVVGEKDGVGFSAVSNDEGVYYLNNLPAGTYHIKGWISGYESEQFPVTVNAPSAAEQNIALTKGATGSVSGTISFLATTALETDVSLTHPITEEAIPGLNTLTSSSYTIKNVPSGNYLARATYKNDERVVDPDWIIKFGEPFVEVGTTEATRNFSLTNSVKLVEPTNVASTTIPVVIASSTPVFQWTAYSSANDYVIEVSDANGNVIWGGFDYSQDIPAKKVIIPSSQTSIEFNADNSATKELVPGRVYRWKIYSSKNDNQAASGWRLISVSEDQLGLFTIAK